MSDAPRTPSRYELRECLRSDERAELWRAFDHKLAREVWLEWAGPGTSAGIEGEIALRQARMLARVHEPRIIRLLEITEHDGRLILVLEPVSGEPLDQLLARESRFEVARVIAIGRDLALAAAAMHDSGVVHRGIAASSVVIRPDGSAALLGFTFAKPSHGGIRTSIEHAARSSDRGRALPDYSAPEQIAGESADARADVFALGCLLFRCSAGRELEVGDGKPLESLDHGLARVIGRCVARSPSARFQNMRELVAALDELSARERTVPGNARAKLGWMALLALAACLLATVEFGWWSAPGVLGSDATADRNPPAYAPVFTGSHALLVGIDYAEDPHRARLRNPVRDIRAFAARLTEIGWRPENITILTDRAATGEAVEAALRGLELCGEEAQVLVYLAGHGEIGPASDAMDGYFIPFDGGPSGVGPTARTHWISFDLLRRELGSFRAKHAMLVLDCCHAGAALRGRRPDASPPVQTRPIAEHLRRRSRVIMCSALAEDLASDGSGDHSPFASGLLRALEPAAKGTAVLGSELFAAATRELVVQGSNQCCWRRILGSADAEFVFLPRR